MSRAITGSLRLPRLLSRASGHVRAVLPRFSLWLLAMLLIGGIIHIFVVLTVPGHVRAKAFAELRHLGPDRIFHVLPPITGGEELAPMLDPAMRHAVCWFRLEDGPLTLAANVDSPFWSMALFNGRGEVVYSLNNRTSGSGALAMLVLTSSQLSILRENPPENLDEMIVIETDQNEGFALLRAFVPDAAADPVLADELGAARCADIFTPDT
ncbi:MAG: DUF1254 domain-containing protein [Polymorphum sp.]|nr:DUF1254 domain-containing protein [Polymorphum sp.]